ncbi:hypothetical protein BHE74_00040232 [Ensete ventricosum]|nr:hypothetical protein GW17_00056619 [Ensete ventricosum]RWW53287.1 hypothetical protein BHE74_00040232 [Ensete ventricosum]RZS13565.1 hypothetical protein BHM03_00045166 [Ensete ventricosum]
MASTTSAAVSMLLSGSMSSPEGLMNPNFLARTMLPYSSSMATISASAPFPTVTLDLTHSTNALQLQRPPVQFPVPFAGVATTAAAGFIAPPQIIGQALHNQSNFSGLQMPAGMEAAHLLHPKPHSALPSSLADSVSAATAAITADPNFTAALAAAISSIISGNHQSASNYDDNKSSANKTSCDGNNNNNKDDDNSSQRHVSTKFHVPVFLSLLHHILYPQHPYSDPKPMRLGFLLRDAFCVRQGFVLLGPVPTYVHVNYTYIMIYSIYPAAITEQEVRRIIGDGSKICVIGVELKEASSAGRFALTRARVGNDFFDGGEGIGDGRNRRSRRLRFQLGIGGGGYRSHTSCLACDLSSIGS